MPIQTLNYTYFKSVAEAFHAACRAGEDAIKEVNAADSKLVGLQAATARAEQASHEAHRELALVQGAVSEAKNQLDQLTTSVARMAPQVKQAEADLFRIHAEGQTEKRAIAIDVERGTAQLEDTTQRLRQAEAARLKVLAEVDRLQAIRAALKTSLESVG